MKQLLSFSTIMLLFSNCLIANNNNSNIDLSEFDHQSDTATKKSAAYTASIVLLTNPFSEIVKLKVTNNAAQSFSAEWRNNQGSFMVSQTFKVNAGANNIQLVPPADVTPGTYYLRVLSDDKKQRQLFRVVKL